MKRALADSIILAVILAGGFYFLVNWEVVVEPPVYDSMCFNGPSCANAYKIHMNNVLYCHYSGDNTTLVCSYGTDLNLPPVK